MNTFKKFIQVLFIGVFFTVFIACKSDTIHKNIIGNWYPDFTSIKIQYGKNIPHEIKNEIETELSNVKLMQFFASKINFEFKENQKLLLNLIDSNQELDYVINNNNITLSGNIDGQDLHFELSILKHSKNNIVFELTGESFLEQLKESAGNDYHKLIADMPEMLDIEMLVIGCIASMAIIRK